MTYDETITMMNFTELLKNEPEKAYDFITYNAGGLSRDVLIDILKEILHSLKYNLNDQTYGDLHNKILEDVQIEIDEKYDEDYQEYKTWNDNIR